MRLSIQQQLLSAILHWKSHTFYGVFSYNWSKCVFEFEWPRASAQEHKQLFAPHTIYAHWVALKARAPQLAAHNRGHCEQRDIASNRSNTHSSIIVFSSKRRAERPAGNWRLWIDARMSGSFLTECAEATSLRTRKLEQLSKRLLALNSTQLGSARLESGSTRTQIEPANRVLVFVLLSLLSTVSW